SSLALAFASFYFDDADPIADPIQDPIADPIGDLTADGIADHGDGDGDGRRITDNNGNGSLDGTKGREETRGRARARENAKRREEPENASLTESEAAFADHDAEEPSNVVTMPDIRRAGSRR